MHFGNEFILVGSVLVVLAIIAGMFSSRLGAPLLLVFLGLGMAAGQDGLGIEFADFQATYLVGSMALAIVLFDGGLRTPRATFRVALWPALVLATAGVVITAVIAGAIAVLALDMTPLQGFLVGATVASTDAAAVFILLHAHGLEIAKRVTATLELESGINDPMAIFLTVIAVEWLLRPDFAMSANTLVEFTLQMGGGAVIGVIGGYALLHLVNRVEIAAGLYPILVVAGTLIIFAGSQSVNASGFLAVYLAGLIMGNHRHRAHAVISRFHDGLAWLAQIVMFLMLGLLVTPSDLIRGFGGEILVAVGLILVARPVAVWLGLLPFRFAWREKAFIAWVGLRGAVPIFLASIPVIAGVPDGQHYFNVAFVVVLVSLIVQGWSIGWSARALGLELPPSPEAPDRQEIDLPTSVDREAAGWAVSAGCPALAVPFPALPLPKRTKIIAVIREGALMDRATLDRLQAGDYVIALVPPEQVIALDKMFSAPPVERRGRPTVDLGEFVFDSTVRLGELCSMYGVPFEPLDHGKSLAEFLHDRLGRAVVLGDRVKIGDVELIVREMTKDRIAKVGLEVEPETERLPILRFWNRLKGALRAVG